MPSTLEDQLKQDQAEQANRAITELQSGVFGATPQQLPEIQVVATGPWTRDKQIMFAIGCIVAAVLIYTSRK